MRLAIWMRVALLCGVGVLALTSPLAAAASSAGSVTIETHGVFTGPDSTAGTFSISGGLSDSGTYRDTFRLAGDTIHVVKTLSGGRGTIILEAQGVVRWTSPTTATFFAGHWRIDAGTGAYADLQGGGYPGGAGTVNFAAATVDIIHAGWAQLG
jgi:hypothetical protein